MGLVTVCPGNDLMKHTRDYAQVLLSRFDRSEYEAHQLPIAKIGHAESNANDRGFPAGATRLLVVCLYSIGRDLRSPDGTPGRSALADAMAYPSCAASPVGNTRLAPVGHRRRAPAGGAPPT